MPTFDAEIISGKLPRKNLRLEIARQYLQIKASKLQLLSIGDRTFLDTEEFADMIELVTGGQKSDYYDNFRQGSTIIPRQFWFVDVIVSPRVGINPRMPTVKTSRRALELAKKEYAEVQIRGQIERDFLYQTVTGTELLPFGHLQLPLVVLPIETTAGKYRIISRDEATTKGFSGLSAWLSEGERIWRAKRGEKAERMTIYQRLNYARTLTNQSSTLKFKVLYNTSGTYLAACVAKNEPHKIAVDGVEVETNGLVADHKTYCWDTDNEEEANYVVGFLNAPIIDKLIKPMQSKGGFGERDIHKKVLELPIPRYNPQDEKHRHLIDLAKACGIKVKISLPSLIQRYDSIGKIRQIVKQELENELGQIDKCAREILLSRRGAHKLDSLLQSNS